ncbi:MAG TPA: NADH-quinone oxidoreductase subunit J [Nitrospinota bacterium]|nr:NADH-quinone oxidoreductase subunit J [Nitrospinota bacterium]
MEILFFYLFAGIGTISAIMVITRRNVIHCALFLVLTFLCVAAIYVLLKAELLAGIQVLVYAGAIMVLFLFAILLINVERTKEIRYRQGQSPWAIILATVVFAQIAYLIFKTLEDTPFKPLGELSPDKVSQIGNTEVIGSILYTKFLFPFEVVSVLLLAAMIGAIILAKRFLKK